MNIMENFEKAKQELYNHVGFEEDWTAFAIKNRTDMFWTLNEIENSVQYADYKEDLNPEENFFCEDEIYKQRFYNKWIYRGEELTMIIVDTHIDGNKFFAFFSNNMEVK